MDTKDRSVRFDKLTAWQKHRIEIHLLHGYPITKIAEFTGIPETIVKKYSKCIDIC